jgi:predicted DsbA family dithiol-disulfide isomerase
MLNKRSKIDFKDKVITSINTLDNELFKAVKEQNRDYSYKFNNKYILIKKNIQKAPTFLRISLNRSLEDIRKKAENFGINIKK